MKTRRVRVRSPIRLWLAMAGAAAASLTLSFAAGNSWDAPELPAPGPILAVAGERAPFAIRQPEWIPAGYQMLNVDFIEPNVEEGWDDFAVDIWYADAAGNRLHIWQTDIPDLELKDPFVVPSNTVSIDGVEWAWVPDHLGPARLPVSVLSARLSDGVFVSVDGTLGQSTLERIVASLR